MNMAQAFAVLGLQRDATADQIKARWRELASQHHPDREGGDRDKFIEASDAYNKCMSLLERRVCTACKGKGQEAKQHGFKTVRTTCRFCKGTGKENCK